MEYTMKTKRLMLQEIHDNLLAAPKNKEIFCTFGLDAVACIEPDSGFASVDTLPVEASGNLLKAAGVKNVEAYLLLEKICRHGDFWNENELKQTFERCGQEAMRTAQLNLAAGAILVAISKWPRLVLNSEPPSIKAGENG